MINLNKNPNVDWDSILIGTGLGSLSYATLLAQAGKKVLVLEKASEPGGCASSYTKASIRYEAGATTLVGLEEGLPLQRLFQELEISQEALPLVLLPTAMKVNLGQNAHSELDSKSFLIRNQNKTQWIQEVGSVFGEVHAQKRFWKFMFFLSEHVWDSSKRLIYFPFHKWTDLFRTILNLRWKDFVLFIFSFITVQGLLRLPGFPKSKSFQKFLDKQLLITVQTTSKQAPVTMASAGLTYAHLNNYYLKGGMGELANFFAKNPICTLIHYPNPNGQGSILEIDPKIYKIKCSNL